MRTRNGLTRRASKFSLIHRIFFVFLLGLGTAPVFADVKVLDQDGRERLFSADVLGKDAIIINFVYTHCQGVCPSQGKRFEQLQSLLEKSARTDVRLVSLSIDPERDTPEDLKRWSKQFRAGKNWTLVVASPKDTEALSRQILGMTLSTGEHSPYLAIRNARGQWRPLYGLTRTAEILTNLDAFSKSLEN